MSDKKRFELKPLFIDYVTINCKYDPSERDQTHKVREWRDFLTRIIPTMTREVDGERKDLYFLLDEFKTKFKIPAGEGARRQRMLDHGMGALYKYIGLYADLEDNIPKLHSVVRNFMKEVNLMKECIIIWGSEDGMILQAKDGLAWKHSNVEKYDKLEKPKEALLESERKAKERYEKWEKRWEEKYGNEI